MGTHNLQTQAPKGAFSLEKTMQIPSNWTPEEVFHVTGTLPSHMIETLLERQSKVSSNSVFATLREVSAQFPAEDFLEPVMKALRGLNVRGDNLEKLNRILNQLGEIQDEVRGNVEYAKDEIKQLREELA